MTHIRLSYKLTMVTLAFTLAVGLYLMLSSASNTSTNASTPDANVQLVATHPSQSSAQSEPSTPRQDTSHRRSFSFHYLDVLEWLFAGSRERAPTTPQQGPNTSSF